MKIHASAIVSADTSIADSVEIGPFVLIEEGVVIGENTRIAPGAVIKKGCRLGKRNVIGEQALIGGDPQDLSFNKNLPSGVIIGDDNVIREMVSIHRATEERGVTCVGNGCFLMTGSHLAHDVMLGNEVVIANNSLLAGHVRVEDNVFISGNCAVHQFTSIGESAMVGGIGKVIADVPPYVMADGHPVRYVGLNNVGMRRRGISSEARRNIKRYYKLLFSFSNLREGKEALEKEAPTGELKTILDFLSKSKRTVIRPKI